MSSDAEHVTKLCEACLFKLLAADGSPRLSEREEAVIFVDKTHKLMDIDNYANYIASFIFSPIRIIFLILFTMVFFPSCSRG